MSKLYMLDTNVVSHIMQGRDSALLQRLSGVPMGSVVISSVTLAELEYGLQRRGQPVRLRHPLTEFLLRVDVLPWDASVARRYGVLCAELDAQGINFSDMDTMIAAHAVSLGATLVSRDRASEHIPGHLSLEVW